MVALVSHETSILGISMGFTYFPVLAWQWTGTDNWSILNLNGHRKSHNTWAFQTATRMWWQRHCSSWNELPTFWNLGLRLPWTLKILHPVRADKVSRSESLDSEEPYSGMDWLWYIYEYAFEQESGIWINMCTSTSIKFPHRQNDYSGKRWMVASLKGTKLLPSVMEEKQIINSLDLFYRHSHGTCHLPRKKITINHNEALRIRSSQYL